MQFRHMVTPGLVSESLGTYITQMYSQIGPNGPQTRIQHHAHLRGSILRIRVRAFFLDKSASRSFFSFFFALSPPRGGPGGLGGARPGAHGRARARSARKQKEGQSRVSTGSRHGHSFAVKNLKKYCSGVQLFPPNTTCMYP